MSEDAVMLTRTGYQRLSEELDNLVNVDAVEMAERIAELREESDFSEEPTFVEAMKEKDYLDARIASLRSILARAEIIDDETVTDEVSPGDRVRVLDVTTKKEISFDLLHSQEIAHGRPGVSIAAPVGKALLGHKVGDTVTVEVPDGEMQYQILHIGRIPDID